MNGEKTIVMIASENDALVGGKVGGVGDVVRNLPRALASLGWSCTVVIPSYGFLHKRNPSALVRGVRFPFRGKQSEAELWRVTAREPCDGVEHLVLEQEEILGNPIYYDDPPAAPFMRDATKYAMFCSAVGQWLKSADRPAVLHLHDWHAAMLLLLRELHPSFLHLRGIRTAFTIHNLAIQGTRPMRTDPSSVESWFPELMRDDAWLPRWKDPRYEEPCCTPMLIGIRHADAVNTVSPTYAKEILSPSDHARGYYGGEGLEKFLQLAKRESRLSGILNGCDYPEGERAKPLALPALANLLRSELQKMKRGAEPGEEEMLLEGIGRLEGSPPVPLLTAVGRIVDQKMRLLFERTSGGGLVLDEVMGVLAGCGGFFLVLGSGAAEYERKLTEAARRHDRLLFIRGYSEPTAQALYSSGTLFIMPSSFEPCGISQMIAMREGQPCLVHAVGGLKDTVRDGINGFTFSGDTLPEQADGLLTGLKRALDAFFRHGTEWAKVAEAAKSARFTWLESAKRYIALMYQG